MKELWTEKYRPQDLTGYVFKDSAQKEQIELLKKEGAEDVVVFGGGIVPKDDIVKLKNLGVKEIFTPGAKTSEIVNWVRDNITPIS
jgi:methylmalonyl-CoA mutase cobalamin-binding domain/chain